MDFKDAIKQLGERVIKLKENIQTEEATRWKNLKQSSQNFRAKRNA